MLFGASAPAQSSDDVFHYRPEWRKFGAADYIATGVLVASLVTLEMTQGEPTYATWTRPLPGERVTRDAIVAGGRSTRERAARAGELGRRWRTPRPAEFRRW